MTPTLFKSKKVIGAVMNSHSCVILNGVALDKEERSIVVREAMDAGWHKVRSTDSDVGTILVPPEVLNDGKGVD